MNSMSVSPVKQPLNSGNLAVPPTTATNLSKSSLPSNNSFTPLNLVPESKSAASIPAASTTLEKSVESSAKAPQSTPTSNGSVSPLPDTGQGVIVASIQNYSEKNESAENLSTNNTNSRTDNTVEEPAKPKVEVEEKKEEKKLNTETKGSSTDIKAAPVKDTTAQYVSVNEVPSSNESSSMKKDEGEEKKKKDEKKTETANRQTESDQVGSAPAIVSKKEPSTESGPTKVIQEEKKPANLTTTKQENEDVKTEAEPICKKKIESDVAVEPAVVSTDNTSKTVTPPKATKRKAKTPVESIAEEENSDSRKSKRTRLPTQPYQSPIPELQFIAKLNTPAKTTPKTSNEKIIAFYKNEFLAVRNPEGSFYICQAFQNIHRNSTKIKIRWFTNLPQNIYTPDFYDTTEFDCILTNVTMNRVEKDRWKLPDQEQMRIENILKRALDVEKGVVEQPSVTEEHPDGLDLSLYKDEAQLQKKKVAASPKKSTPPETKKTKNSKRTTKAQQKTTSATPSTSSAAAVKKSPRVSSYVNRDSAEANSKAVEKSAKKEKKEKKKKKNKSSKKQANSAASKTDSVSSKTWEPSVKASNSSRVVLSLRKEDSSAKNITTETKGMKRTSNVSQRASAAAVAAATATPPASTAAVTPPAKRRKEESKSSPNNTTPCTTEKTGKVRNAGSAVSAKINSAAIRTTKEKERKAATTASQRKK